MRGNQESLGVVHSDLPPEAADGSGEQESTPAEVGFRRLVETIPAIVYVETDERPFPTTYISPRIEDALGYAPEEFIGDRDFWTELVHPDDLQAVQAIEARSYETREPYLAEYRLLGKDARWHWFRDEAVFSEADNVWQGVMIEITAEKEVGLRLRELEARYRNLVEQLPAVTYLDAIDEANTSIYVSPQVEDVLGIPSEAFQTLDLWEAHVHPEDREAAVRATRESVASGEPFCLEYRMIRADGSVTWIRDQASVVRDSEGRPDYVQGIFLDVTEQKRSQHELEEALGRERQSAEIKDTFLRAVSHDLRSPLAAILGSAITLEREGELGLSSETRQELAHGLALRSRKLAGIVSDLLDIDRLTRNALEPRLVPTDLGELIERVIRESDAAQGRVVQTELSHVVLAVDASMLERIIDNLLGNALKHTTAGASIWLRLLLDEEGVVIAVEDDGPGVAEELRETLFGAFARGASAERVPGLGLGLSIVARFAELHDGRAWVEQRPGGGASFRVFLPYGP